MDGIVNDSTTPATAIFDFEILKTTIKRTKLSKFMANWEKNSDIRRNKKEGVDRAEMIGFRIKINLLFDYILRFLYQF